MEFVLYSVLCSVTVSVLLKLARNYAVDTQQIIIWNYPTAVGLTFYFYKPELATITIPELPWLLYVSLGLLLPAVFFALSESIRYTGIVRTEVAQRLSLCIPLIAAFWLFGEKARTETLFALGLGLIAILCIIGWHKGGGSKGKGKRFYGNWLFPLLVFVGYGVCDILFKLLAQSKMVPYTTSMFFVFVLATVASLCYLVYYTNKAKNNFSMAAVFWGIVLGGFNFSNILFYMKAHRALPENPSIVFTGMNIGVISIGALVGLILFREKLSNLNIVGILLAVVAVFLLAVFHVN